MPDALDIDPAIDFFSIDLSFAQLACALDACGEYTELGHTVVEIGEPELIDPPSPVHVQDERTRIRDLLNTVKDMAFDCDLKANMLVVPHVGCLFAGVVPNLCSPTDMMINELLHRPLQVTTYMAVLKEMEGLFSDMLPDLVEFLNGQLALDLVDFNAVKRKVFAFALQCSASFTILGALA